MRCGYAFRAALMAWTFSFLGGAAALAEVGAAPFSVEDAVGKPAPPVFSTGEVVSPAARANALLPGEFTVHAFGAKGDGIADDTEAFQEALDAAGKTGGVVKAGAGRFLIKGHLNIPANVTLEGLWRAPSRADVLDSGTVLLPTEGKGDPNGSPFLTLNSSSVLKGLTVFYPEQTPTNPPQAYPWTVRGRGDNNSILSVTLVNPYQAVDFGTEFCGRHYINGLYAQALYRGLFIDQCYDVGRIENIHFWPFWNPDLASDVCRFTYEKGVAFLIARTDGEEGVNLFQIGYNIGFHFVDAGHGGGSGMYTNLYSDVSPCAVNIEASHAHAPISIVNASLMSGLEVSVTRQTLVSLVAVGFWPGKGTDYHAKLAGPATVLFSACRFHDWDKRRNGAAAIEANCDAITLTGSDFSMKRSRALKVRLGAASQSAIIVGNRMRGGVVIDSRAAKKADLQIGLNSGK